MSTKPVVYFMYSGGHNAGDLYCCPKFHYEFPEFEVKELFFRDIEQVRAIQNSVIVFGGGGIIDVTTTMSKFYRHMVRTNRCFHWGSGSNKLNPLHIDWALNEDEVKVADDILDKFVLVGRRDYLPQYYANHSYVPCVSCKLPQLQEEYVVKRRIGIVNHVKLKQITGLNYPTINMDLNQRTIDDIVRFIGESEIVIVSSYHAAYWGLLLGKKVLINGNWSSKFDTLKYPVTLLTSDLEECIARCVIAPSTYLSECIRLNDEFYTQIRSYLVSPDIKIGEKWRHNTFFTHQPVLQHFTKDNRKPILELGSGDGSTPYLHALACLHKVKLTTLDNDEKWLSNYTHLRGEYHALHALPQKCGASVWVDRMRSMGLSNQKWGVVFIDQHPWAARVAAIEMFKTQADWIIVHDADYFPEQNLLGTCIRKVSKDTPGIYDFSDVFTQWKMYWPPTPWCSPTGPPTLVGTMRSDLELPRQIACKYFNST